MSENAIIVEGLSKTYLIGHRRSGGQFKYKALRDVIGQEIRNFARKAGDVARGRQIVQGDEVEEFHALSDVSFTVKQGEVLGIVGRNGAGKSTLLKILSRITEPSQGRITLYGRISSLLEVGTGFHPELTGRENIFLNGAVLGMTRREILRKFDEIVAFAEVDRFLDTPVKHYSSGMYVRLAFAVAAHLEPEILIVDEVLAVGDVEFQKKCLGKMNEVSRSAGRTVLFVSHNMDAIRNLCSRAIMFEAGRVRQVGDTDSVVSAYLNRRSLGPQVIELAGKMEPANFAEKVRPVALKPLGSTEGWLIPFGDELALELTLDVNPSVKQVELAIGIRDASDFELVTLTSYAEPTHLQVHGGLNTFRITFERLRLLPRQYSLVMTIGAGRGFEAHIPDAASFEIVANAKAAQVNAEGIRGAILASTTITATS
ncbi:polysaccharide ABC transporter ATP-binding protein [Bradyrhizobium symbiodeficiens]|uniref:ABC transporter ATP-binding protein n=1 Tax=Bradyrhizobium symbiodeficiens TaxID=1404367 RepID=UPI0030CE7320